MAKEIEKRDIKEKEIGEKEYFFKALKFFLKRLHNQFCGI